MATKALKVLARPSVGPAPARSVAASSAPSAAPSAVPTAAPLAAALADPTREQIVRLLVERELAVGELAERLPVSRPAVSKHLRVLEGAGLVQLRAEGTRRLYAVDPAALATLRDELDRLWRHALARFALVANNTGAAALAAAGAPSNPVANSVVNRSGHAPAQGPPSSPQNRLRNRASNAARGPAAHAPTPDAPTTPRRRRTAA